MIAVAGAALIALIAPSAPAATLTLTASDTSIPQGGTVTVDISISGLITGSAPSLSAFDLELTFDGNVLGWTGITFGDPGGDQLDLLAFGPITAYDDSTAGSIFFSEISLDDPLTLDTVQIDSFRLAQLTFEGAAAGVTTLDLPSIMLLDAIGDPIALDSSVVPLQVAVVVPLPAALWLLGGALGTLSLLRRRAAACDAAGASPREPGAPPVPVDREARPWLLSHGSTKP
ncbi:MAG: cohesin domain-containing protein [Gammaproteobacteria bacterium]|nr:MAG: cohesin domain-containing protein [Gammaproteobacteria bacterium]